MIVDTEKEMLYVYTVICLVKAPLNTDWCQ